MSRRYEWGAVAGSAPVAAGYVPGAEFREELGERPSKPGNSALVIGDPYATAYVLEGTPAELRAYLAKLAALIPAEPPAGGVSGVPEVLEYEGHVKFADGTVISLQCFEGRCAECPDEVPDGELADDDHEGRYGPGVLDGYDCEHGCGHGTAAGRIAGVLASLLGSGRHAGGQVGPSPLRVLAREVSYPGCNPRV